MGFRGLALGTALAAMFNAVAPLAPESTTGSIDGRRVAVALVKVLVASAVMGWRRI